MTTFEIDCWIADNNFGSIEVFSEKPKLKYIKKTPYWEGYGTQLFTMTTIDIPNISFKDSPKRCKITINIDD